MLELVDLSKTYEDAEVQRQVLCDTNAMINTGEFVAIRGRSGSGKTTLLNLIAGIDTPSSGEVIIDGISIHKLNPKGRAAYRRDNIGFVFQFFNLLPNLKVIENVSLPAELAKIDQKQAEERALALLEEVDLADRAEDFPERLSGGEQQRVAIARALIRDPKIILADEPTGNLDETMGDQILDLLLKISRGIDRTIILVTHSHHIATKADRILTIKDCTLVPEAHETIQRIESFQKEAGKVE